MTEKVENYRFSNQNHDNSTLYNINKVEDDLGRTKVNDRSTKVMGKLNNELQTLYPYLSMNRYLVPALVCLLWKSKAARLKALPIYSGMTALRVVRPKQVVTSVRSWAAVRWAVPVCSIREKASRFLPMTYLRSRPSMVARRWKLPL